MADRLVVRLGCGGVPLNVHVERIDVGEFSPFLGAVVVVGSRGSQPYLGARAASGARRHDDLLGAPRASWFRRGWGRSIYGGRSSSPVGDCDLTGALQELAP